MDGVPSGGILCLSLGFGAYIPKGGVLYNYMMYMMCSRILEA
jgi:hypothetical protein